MAQFIKLGEMWLGTQNHDTCYMQKNGRTLGPALLLALLLHVLIVFVLSVFCDMRCEGNAGYIICVGSYMNEMFKSDMKNVLSIQNATT